MNDPIFIFVTVVVCIWSLVFFFMLGLFIWNYETLRKQKGEQIILVDNYRITTKGPLHCDLEKQKFFGDWCRISTSISYIFLEKELTDIIGPIILDRIERDPVKPNGLACDWGEGTHRYYRIKGGENE